MRHFLLFVLISAMAAARQPWQIEEIEFRLEPSLGAKGIIVDLQRSADGKLVCSWNRLKEIHNADGIVLFVPDDSWRRFDTSSSVFDSLVARLEGAALRSFGEDYGRTGTDGSTFVFTRKASARSLQYRVWSPDRGTLPMQIANAFLSAAGLPPLEMLKDDGKKPN